MLWIKKTLAIKSASPCRYEVVDKKNLFPLVRKTASTVTNWTNLKKIGLQLISSKVSTSGKELWLKEQSLVIYRKYNFHKPKQRIRWKIDFTVTKNCFHSNQCLQKIEENIFTSRYKFFSYIHLLLIAIVDSKKYEWKNIVSTNKKAVATGRKGFV